MRRRLLVVPVVVLAALGLGGAPAATGQDATEPVVVAQGDDTFSPAAVRIEPGGAVRFRNGEGFHDVVFDDGSFRFPDQPSNEAWSTRREFPNPGRYDYYCSLHGAPGGVGMAGVVQVGDPAAPAAGLRILRQDLDVARRRGVKVQARTSAPGFLVTRLRISGRLQRRLGLRSRIVGQRDRTVEAGRTTFRVRLKRSARRAFGDLDEVRLTVLGEITGTGGDSDVLRRSSRTLAR